MADAPRIDPDLVVDLTRDLIRFRSVNPPGDEEPVARYLAGRMEEFGIQADVQLIEPGRANLIARLPGNGAGHLVYTGHMDVVPPGEQPWEHDPYGADAVDGVIYGRGSADMKGGVAAIVAAMAALASSSFRPRADVVLAATAGEEAGLYGARFVVENGSLRDSSYLVVAEPTDLNVLIAEKGILWVDVQAYGRTAHGSMPWLGANAIAYMARLIPRLEEYPLPFQESELLGKPTLSVNIISGGNKANVVPDACRITLDMRTVPSQRHPEIVDAIREMARRTADEYNPEIRTEIEVVHDENSVETQRTEPLVEATVRAVQRVRGEAPSVAGVNYATDAAILGPGYDIPMVICGPGAPGMAHQPDEHVEVDQLVKAAQIYATLAVDLLS
jgi:succinyl-diaminopimelate desuccinylase